MCSRERGGAHLNPGCSCVRAAPQAIPARTGPDFVVVSRTDGDAFAAPPLRIIAGEVDATFDMRPGGAAVGGFPDTLLRVAVSEAGALINNVGVSGGNGDALHAVGGVTGHVAAEAGPTVSVVVGAIDAADVRAAV